MNPSKRVYSLSILLALFLFGCATTQTIGGHSIIGPDGTENEVLSCWNIDDCYSFARQVCGGSYKIVNSNTDTYSYGGKYAATSSSFILLVKCDSGKASFPAPTGPLPPGVSKEPGAEFPDAHSFQDCEQYVSLYKDRCREEVFARNQKKPAPTESK